MRPNRKADLQRKLTLAAVPTPPPGLAERIKTDIPKHFPDSTVERRRLGNAVAFNMRVAASILLLVGSLFTALYILNGRYQDEQRHMEDFSSSLKTNNPPSAAASPVPKLPQNAKVVTSTEEPPATVAPPEPRRQVAENEIAETKAKTGERQPADAGVLKDQKKDEATNGPGKELAELDKQRDDFRRAAPATAPAAPVAVPKPAPPPPASVPPEVTAKVATEQPSAAYGGRTADGVNPTAAGAPTPHPAQQKDERDSSARKAAQAGSVQSAQAPALAGRAKLERAPRDSVTSLVQHFSGPAERPRRGVSLEADAAPSPVDSTKGVLRISIDTVGDPAGFRYAPTPVATGARLEIEINGRTVASHRAVTSEPFTGGGTLEEGLSSTAVYEFQLAPGSSGQTVLATVRLHFRSATDGREQTIERTVSVRDIATSWDAASLRTKRASLAAAYADARSRGADTSAIAEKARAIGLDELADLAKQH
jgi:hypothetical protein